MTDSMRRRSEFTKALRDMLAKLEDEGTDRIERSRVEEIGQRFDIDRDEALRVFVDSKGTLWQGELIESDEEPGWEAATLEHVPPAGADPTRGL